MVPWRPLVLYVADAIFYGMDMRKLVGRNAARLRAAAGLTQEQLAERSGLNQQYLSDLERGKLNPTVVTLYELATALGVSHVELVRPD
jgi:transcriptional regulator with XRE-family HTH domain